MTYVKCKICFKELYVKPSHQKRGYGKYCSKKCQFEGQRKGKYVVCEICGTKTWRAPRALKLSQSNKFFCCKSCQTIWRNKRYIGPLHANWQGGESTYKRIMKESKIKPKCKNCGITDKRVLVIHHIDKNRKNNDISNLIWLCLNCHHLVHNKNVNIK